MNGNRSTRSDLGHPIKELEILAGLKLTHHPHFDAEAADATVIAYDSITLQSDGKFCTCD